MADEKSIDINVSPQKVWPFMVEPEKILKWCITFKKFEYTSQQNTGVGTTVYIEEQAGGPLMKLNFKITDYKENEKLVLHMVSGSGVKVYDLYWSLVPIPTGTRFTLGEEVELPFGMVGRLLRALMKGSTMKTLDQMLMRLKTLAEA